MDMLQAGSNVSMGPPLGADMSSQASVPPMGPSGQWRSAGDSVYSQVVSGYDYTQGYHFLMRFLSERSAIPFPFLHQSRSAMVSAATSTEAAGEDQMLFRGGLSRESNFGTLPSSVPPMSATAPSSAPSAPTYPSTRTPNTFVDQSPIFLRFEKNDILRVVRALAIFRPSLIALQMPMSEQDEVFVERALQRSLLVCRYPCFLSTITHLTTTSFDCFLLPLQELEKLISYSGTPTAIWRRTGEICIVGLEFSMLTGWSKDELIGQRKFIYEVCPVPPAPQRSSLAWPKTFSHLTSNSLSPLFLLARTLCAFG